MAAPAEQGNRRGNSSISRGGFLNEINSLGRRFGSHQPPQVTPGASPAGGPSSQGEGPLSLVALRSRSSPSGVSSAGRYAGFDVRLSPSGRDHSAFRPLQHRLTISFSAGDHQPIGSSHDEPRGLGHPRLLWWCRREAETNGYADLPVRRPVRLSRRGWSFVIVYAIVIRVRKVSSCQQLPPPF